MTAGYGVAPLFLGRALLESRRLPAAGRRSAREPYELVSDRLDLTREARGLELGHLPFAGVFALGGALTMLEEIGIDRIGERVQELTDRLHGRMSDQGIAILSPRGRESRSGITVLDVGDPQAVVDGLRAASIFVAARRSGLRVALHFYTNEDDIDRFATAVSDILQ